MADRPPLVPKPVDVVEAWGCGYLDGTAIVALARYLDSGDIADLVEAREALGMLHRRAITGAIRHMHDRPAEPTLADLFNPEP